MTGIGKLNKILASLLNRVVALEYDYIVEEGTAGDWYYEKYQSGIVKLYLNTLSSLSISSASGGWYYSTKVQSNFPFTLTSVINAVGSVMASGQTVLAELQDLNTTCVGWQLLSNSSRSAASRPVCINVLGRWK